MEKIKILETYEEFLKTLKKDLLKISKMDISFEVTSRLVRFINKAEDEYRKRKQITKSKKKTKTILEDLYGE